MRTMRAQRPGCHGAWSVSGSTSTGDRDGARHGERRLHGVLPRGRPSGTPPAGPLRLAGHDGGDVAGLRRYGVVHRLDGLVVGTAVDAGDGSGMRRVGAGEGHRSRARTARRPCGRGTRCGAAPRRSVESTEVRISGASSESGLATRTAYRRSSSAGRPSASATRRRRTGRSAPRRSPRATSALATIRRTRWPWVRPRPEGGVRHDRRDLVVAVDPGDLLRVVRAVDRSGRHVGGVTRSGGAAVVVDRAALGPEDLDHALARVVDAHQPGRQGDVEVVRRRAASCSSTSVTAGSAVPPPCSTSRSTQSWAAAGGSAGSTPRSNRLDASVTSLCRRDERATVTGSKCAASMRTSVVDGVTSLVAPPMTPAMPRGRRRRR